MVVIGIQNYQIASNTNKDKEFSVFSCISYFFAFLWNVRCNWINFFCADLWRFLNRMSKRGEKYLRSINSISNNSLHQMLKLHYKDFYSNRKWLLRFVSMTFYHLRISCICLDTFGFWTLHFNQRAHTMRLSRRWI